MKKGDIACIHNDGFDNDKQVMLCCGKYNGGELIMYNEDQSKSLHIDLHNRCFTADPRFIHEVLPVTNGIRYSLIIFRHFDEMSDEPFPMIDYVDTNFLSTSKKYISLKDDVEQACLAWIGCETSSSLSHISNTLVESLRKSPYDAEHTNRPQLNLFIEYIQTNFHTQSMLKKHMKESKYIINYVFLCTLCLSN